jgi:hypothetical protein
MDEEPIRGLEAGIEHCAAMVQTRRVLHSKSYGSRLATELPNS